MRPMESLQRATGQREEIEALEELKASALGLGGAGGAVEEDVEREWLSLASSHLGEEAPANPFPASSPDALMPTQSDLDRFTCYLFERRFSWSEAVSPSFWTGPEGLAKPYAAIATEEDAQLKERLNSILDEFLKWYICQDVSLPLLKSLHATFTQACNKPVVRNQTMIHVMEWLQMHCHKACLHAHFASAQALVLAGLCDVWSAIRSACATRLGRIAAHLTLAEVESLFAELTKVCEDTDSTWQSIEGALMAINLLLKSFQWIGVLPTTSVDEQCATNGQFFLKIGTQELSQLPEFIGGRMRQLVYPLLAHPQLAVRDGATKAFSTYLSRCDFQVALQSLREAVVKLSGDVNFEAWAAEPALLSHRSALRSGPKFLSACESEGLLNVCLYLIKHLQSGILLPYWPKYFSTFGLYLMHPASTVRQAASVIFKYIVAKESNSPALLKLLLQSLCADWAADLGSSKWTRSSGGGGSGRQYQSTLRPEKRQSPPGRDGGRSSKHAAVRRQFSTEQEQAMGIEALLDMEDESVPFSRAWEWREGRLFAYELIVKFLIINHIHYLFPSYALPPSKFDGSVSADEAIARSHQPVAPKRQPMSKSFSNVGNTTASHQLAGAGDQDDEVRERAMSTAESVFHNDVQQSLTRSGSERRKIILEERRSRTLAEGSFFKKQYSKHYSYFTNQSSQADRRRNPIATATSLLCKVRNADAAVQGKDDASSNGGLLMVPSPIRQPAAGSPNAKTLPDHAKSLLKSALSASKLCGRPDNSEDLEWLRSLDLQTLAALLRQILLQTVGCLADGRWEVRRMAQQALPLIAECIRWYDMSILTSLWDAHLCPKESLACYGMALTLAVSVHHVVRLVHFMDAPPVSWKDPDICRGITLPIVTMLTQGLTNWCSTALALLERTTVDKLTMVAMEIVMTTHIYFPELLIEKSRYEMAVVRKILHVFSHAHPDHPHSQQDFCDDSLLSFSTPADGLLCCCPRAECLESPARQVERHLLSELHQFLPAFVQSGTPQAVCGLLPVFLHLVGHHGNDSHVAKSLLESCAIIGNKLVRVVPQMDSSSEKEHLVQTVPSAMIEMAAVVSLKDLEMATLKQVFDLFTVVSGLVQDPEQFIPMLSAISARFDLSDKNESGRGTSQSSSDEDPASLVYLSNNIPASAVETAHSTDEEEEEEDKKHSSNHAAESLSLSMSSGSGQTLWPAYAASEPDPHRLSGAQGGSQGDSDSDWDSWDEEEEDQTAWYGVVSDFVQKLQESHKMREQGGQSPLHLAFRQLKMKDQTLLHKLLAQC